MELVMLVYMLLLCGFLPLYMNAGYVQLGEAKALCYLVMSIPFALALIIGLIIGKRKELKEQKINTQVSEFFLYGTLFSFIISFVFSVDKKTAFLGFEGWRNGLLVSLLALSFCVIICEIGFLKSFVLALLFLAPFFEFVLSILNRMSLYPFAIAGQNNSFLATVGNIDWFSGFLSIWVPLGIGYMHVQKRFSLRFFLLGVYSLAGLVAVLMQGSDGASLIVMSCYVLLLWFSLRDRDEFKSFLIQLMVLGLAMIVVDVLMYYWGYLYSYDENLLIMICKSHAGAILVAAAFFVYRVSRLFEEIKVSFWEKAYKKIYLVALICGLFCAVYFLIMNFNDDFGNGRGIIWRMCVDLYLGLSPWQKLVGIGQDCLYSYAMADDYWRSSFLNVFGNAALTNAHCDFLTILIERGFIGVVTYLGLFGSVLYQLIHIKEKEPTAIICALPVISYLVYSQITFTQVTSMPYCFILIGIAISLIKVRNSN